jgi:oligoendopeptidase F
MKNKGEVWNLADVFGKESYDSINKKIEENAKIIEGYRTMLPRAKPLDVLKLIQIMEETGVMFSKLESFYALKTSENTQDEESLAKLSALSMKGADFESRTMFFQLWLLSLDDATAEKLISSKELVKYEPYLRRMRLYKPYTRSEEVEQILTIKDVTGGDAFSDLYDIHTSSYKFDIGKRKGLTQEEVSAQFMSPDPKMREEAYISVYTKYKNDSVYLSEIYKNIVLDWSNEVVKIRGYKSSISARNIGNTIDDESLAMFTRVIRKNAGLISEYFKLKHKILSKGKKQFKFSRYHIYAPYETKEKIYTYEESKKIVLETFRKLDERFYLAAKKVFDEHHIHSHPKAGKRGGAFCSTVSTKITPYVLLNFTERFVDVSTMMHEIGHAIHSIFSAKQTEVLAHAKIPLAETASTFAELLLVHEMIEKTKDVEEKKSLLLYSLDQHYRSVTRQMYFVIFEMWAHEKIKDGVTKKEMDDYYYSLLKEQFGSMEIPEIFAHEWNYIPHIHHTPFYCYGYAWGHLLVLSLFAMYKKQGAKFVDKYIKFLSAGSNGSIPEIMKIVGADAKSEEFWQQGFEIIKSEIEELRKIVK